MERIHVQVRQDHLARLAARRPAAGIAELIWNALDADAANVEVKITENGLDGVESVQVLDDGQGIPHERALDVFGSLGGSWKGAALRSSKGRLLHGRAGEGRFLSFAVGTRVTWETKWLKDGELLGYEITASLDDIGTFEISDARSVTGEPGTCVTILGIERPHWAIRSKEVRDHLTEEFALYLRERRDAAVVFDGAKIDPTQIESRVEDIQIPSIELSDGRAIEADLTVIEWSVPVERALVLCDAGGFVLARKQPGIQARGFQFTAYLKSDFMRELDEKHLLEMEDLEPNLGKVITAAKDALRDYFRRRSAEDAVDVVEEWKEHKIYPFEGPPRNVVEQAERQIFDVVALNINEYLPDFERSEDRSKKLSLRMLKAAIEQSPSAVQRIIQDVLDLPKEKQAELADLIEKTSLTAIINATRVITDRLDFLAGLEILVFEAESRKKLLERSQLHRMLADSTWVFGEEFNLSVDDQSMREVLRKHEAMLGREEASSVPVPRIDGTEGIVDLMLSRVIRRGKADEREHLVIELKRPAKRLDNECVGQVESYAYTVADDERFHDTKTRWVFWLVGNDMDELVRKKVMRQKDRPDGQLAATEDGRVTIWVKTWGQVIESCRARLQFFQERLAYMADHDAALAHLQKTYDKYLPKHLRTGQEKKPEHVPGAVIE